MSFLYIKKSCNEILFRLKRLTFWHMFEELIKKIAWKNQITEYRKLAEILKFILLKVFD